MQVEFITRSPPPKVLIDALSHAVQAGMDKPLVHRATKPLSAPSVRRFSLHQCASALMPMAALSNRARSADAERIDPAEFNRATGVLLRRVGACLVDEAPSQSNIALLAMSLAKLRVDSTDLVDPLVKHARDAVPRLLTSRLLAEVDSSTFSLDVLQSASEALDAARLGTTWKLHLAMSAAMLAKTPDQLSRFGPLFAATLSTFGDKGIADASTLGRLLAVEAPSLLPQSYIVPPPPPSKRTIVTHFHREVCDVVGKLGYLCSSEQDGVDLVIEVKGARVALQCDGPSHFVWSGTKREGRTLLRDRLQRSRFDRLVSLSYADWPLTSPLRMDMIRRLVVG